MVEYWIRPGVGQIFPSFIPFTNHGSYFGRYIVSIGTIVSTTTKIRDGLCLSLTIINFIFDPTFVLNSVFKLCHDTTNFYNNILSL